MLVVPRRPARAHAVRRRLVALVSGAAVCDGARRLLENAPMSFTRESHHRKRSGPRDPGFARQPDRRGRRRRWSRALVGTAAVPSGASTGEHEALELRDGDKKRYLGKGVRKACENVAKLLGPVVVGRDALDQAGLDAAMLGGRRHARTRARSAPTRCWACRWRRRARRPPSCRLPLYKYLGGPSARVLPVPLMNIINGGAHADNSLDFQEFMIVPKGAANFSRGAARRRRGVPHAQEAAPRSQGVDGRRRRGRLRARPARRRGGAGRRHRGDREGRLQAGQGRRAGARRRVERAVGQGEQDATSWKARARSWTARGSSPSTASCASSSRSCRSRTAWPRTTGTAGWR